MLIEIDLYELRKAEDTSSGRPGLVKKKVTVKRGAKTFQQYRWVKSGVEEPTEKPVVEEAPKPKGPVIMGLNKPEKKLKVEEKPKPEKIEKVDTKDLSDRMGFYHSGLKFHPDGEEIINSINDYTDVDYVSINSYLRDEKSGDAEVDKKISHISTFLKNAPKMEGVVYRGMSFGNDESGFNKFLNECAKDKSVMLKSFTSTSTDKVAIGEFKKGDHSITLEIKSKSGVFLDGLSEVPEENEVLFDKKSNFRISEVDRSGYPEHVRITMEEK